MLPDLHIGFSRGRSGGLVFLSLSEFPQFIVIHTIKDFGIVNKAEIDVFLELSSFFNDPTDVGNLISGSSAFLNQLEHLEVHDSRTVEASLENFEHYFARVLDECNYVVVLTFFGIAFLWDWNEN